MKTYVFTFSPKWVFSFLSKRYLYDQEPTTNIDEALDQYCRSLVDVPHDTLMHKQLHQPHYYSVTIRYQFAV